jgi:hypothetical protein
MVLDIAINMLLAGDIAIQYIDGRRYYILLAADIAIQYIGGGRYCNKYILIGCTNCNTIYWWSQILQSIYSWPKILQYNLLQVTEIAINILVEAKTTNTINIILRNPGFMNIGRTLSETSLANQIVSYFLFFKSNFMTTPTDGLRLATDENISNKKPTTTTAYICVPMNPSDQTKTRTTKTNCDDASCKQENKSGSLSDCCCKQQNAAKMHSYDTFRR